MTREEKLQILKSAANDDVIMNLMPEELLETIYDSVIDLYKEKRRVEILNDMSSLQNELNQLR